MTYGEIYHWGKHRLESAGIPEAQLDARLLLEYVCGTGRNDLLVHGDRMLEVREQERYRELIAGREKRIPLQQLTGVQEFMGLEFSVNEQVLIPRQDTEILVEEALRNLHDGMRILDLCTGSGCILISLLHYSNDCEGVGTDISGEALETAKRNAEKLLERRVYCQWDDVVCRPGSISFIQSDLFERVQGKFDMIVSNPPYIPGEVICTLMPEVREHEPVFALDGGGDGLFFYRRITQESREYLVGGGMLFLEIGYDQAGDVRELMEKAGFLEINVVKDYAGLDRVVYGTLGWGQVSLGAASAAE
ncbi:MAG: peptide chain release factor N(5)-glutamine methyltransferase [Lachnospiraceae bacterium]|nr:peptide chain release factor N(5)-glutamine methyltransferase [uncultured Acetatifactor sp.]MCI9221019.1 peptide chain release factor N(5)-glutamine methyltransferase [Lachnospiraceae bacterium]